MANIGIYNLHMRAMGGGEKLTLALAEHLSRVHKVSIFSAEPLDAAYLERFFGVDLSCVSFEPLNAVGPFLRVVANGRGRNGSSSLIHHYLQLRKLQLDVFINNSYGSELMCPGARGIFMCMFPHRIPIASAESLRQRIKRAAVDLIEKQVTDCSASNAIDSYSTVVAISRYSADWVRRLWGRGAEIVYPPCDDLGPPAAKARIILHVGRFIADSNEEWHHKGQRNLLAAFKRMTDVHKEGWQLHFTGSIGIDNDSAQFARTLVQDAEGFPVHFHFNAAREEMIELYRRAAIYWHATGHGFDTDRYPAKQEHFGITTVEAMSAGAVPVVYPSGGQREIVTDGVDGLWWFSIDELLSQTRRLVNEAGKRNRLSEAAVVSSKRFGRHAFNSRVDQLMTVM